MDINDDHLYTIKESSKITSIPERTLSRNALKENARKIDGRYLFSGNQLKGLIERRTKAKEKKENPSPTARHSPLSSPKNTNELEVLVKENESLKMEVKMLKEDLQQYDIGDDERIEVFTLICQRLEADFKQNQKVNPAEVLCRLVSSFPFF